MSVIKTERGWVELGDCNPLVRCYETNGDARSRFMMHNAGFVRHRHIPTSENRYGGGSKYTRLLLAGIIDVGAAVTTLAKMVNFLFATEKQPANIPNEVA